MTWDDDTANQAVDDMKSQEMMGPEQEEPNCHDCGDSGRSCWFCHPNRWQRLVWPVWWRLNAVRNWLRWRSLPRSDDEPPF